MVHFIGQLFSLVSNFFSADCGKGRGGANRGGGEAFCNPSDALAFLPVEQLPVIIVARP